ncbi:hypothetical protein DFP96_1216 [Listeria rocourtiae]|uniref:Uncharacterized protein n=1 Tax=Listeria rocourtiae TaxID=647910 RepID=A0A4R6ZEJ4_9LIST|nr:hypothetical protein DFP96_1216 [Listeria rocourtiae]
MIKIVYYQYEKMIKSINQSIGLSISIMITHQNLTFLVLGNCFHNSKK